MVRRHVKFVEAVEDRSTTSHLIDDEVESAASQAAGENDRAAQAGAADAANDSVAGEQADGGAEELREATGAGEQSEKVPARDANPANAPKRTLPPRLREPSKRAFKDAYALMAQVETPDEPATLEAALQQPDGELWQQAADDEMKSLQDGTAVACQNKFTVTQLTLDCSESSVVYCRWQWTRLFAQHKSRKLPASVQSAAGHGVGPAIHQGRTVHLVPDSGQTMSLLRLA